MQDDSTTEQESLAEQQSWAILIRHNLRQAFVEHWDLIDPLMTELQIMRDNRFYEPEFSCLYDYLVATYDEHTAVYAELLFSCDPRFRLSLTLRGPGAKRRRAEFHGSK